MKETRSDKSWEEPKWLREETLNLQINIGGNLRIECIDTFLSDKSYLKLLKESESESDILVLIIDSCQVSIHATQIRILGQKENVLNLLKKSIIDKQNIYEQYLLALSMNTDKLSDSITTYKYKDDTDMIFNLYLNNESTLAVYKEDIEKHLKDYEFDF